MAKSNLIRTIEADEISDAPDTAGKPTLLLHAQPFIVFEQFNIDGDVFVHGVVHRSITPQVFNRDRFDDVTGWIKPDAEEIESQPENPLGASDLDD